METHKKRQWQFTLLYLVMAVALFYFIQKSASSGQPKQISYTDFINDLQAGKLAEASISKDKLTATLKDDAAKSDGVKSITAIRLPDIATHRCFSNWRPRTSRLPGKTIVEAA